jgi:hypothetical protein
MNDFAEMSRITSSYIARLSPDEVRLSRIGRFIWLRLRVRTSATNLLFRLPTESPRPRPVASSFRPTPAERREFPHDQIDDGRPSYEGLASKRIVGDYLRGSVVRKSWSLLDALVAAPKNVLLLRSYSVLLNNGTASASVTTAKIDR